LITLKIDTARSLPVLLVDGGGAVVTDVAEEDVTVVISKNGGALTGFTLTDKWTELGQGLYTIDFADTDLDTVGFFAYLVTATGCDQYSGIMYVSDWETTVDSMDGKVDSVKAITDLLPIALIILSGVSFRGVVTAADPGVSFTISTLAGIGDGTFVDANSPWYAYVLRDAGGTAAAPQGEQKRVTGYTSATGLFTTDAFTAAVAVGDDIVVMSNKVASIEDIIADTNELQTDLADGGRLDELLDAIKAKTDNLPTDPADESLLEAELLTVETNVKAAITDAEGNIRDGAYDLHMLYDDLNTIQTALNAIKGIGWVDENLTTIDALIDAIQAKTDNLPGDPADQSSLEGSISNMAIDIVSLLSADITDAQTALTAVLTAMKGAGWTDETLKAIKDAVDANGNDIDDAINNQTIMDGKLTAIKLIEDYLKQKESGRWKIANNQLTFYEDDNITPLRTFNLFNKDGAPSNDNPYERYPV